VLLLPIEDYICVTFQSVHTALQFERKLKLYKTSLRLIPVPRKISASCGMAAKLTWEDWKLIQDKIDSLELEFEKVFQIQGELISELSI
jgi:hypothetical protein